MKVSDVWKWVTFDDIEKKKLLKNVKRNFHVFLCLISDGAFKVEPKIYFIKTWLKAIEIKDLLLKNL